MTAGKQLELFTAETVRKPVTATHLRLARRAVRTIRARGPLRVTDLAMVIGAEVGDTWLAVGIARRWGRIEVRDGVAALAGAREEGAE